jgi:hypothetical protein
VPCVHLTGPQGIVMTALSIHSFCSGRISSPDRFHQDVGVISAASFFTPTSTLQSPLEFVMCMGAACCGGVLVPAQPISMHIPFLI